MARPQSMPDVASLLNASSNPLPRAYEKERPTKKPSISLAAGLIMASESNSAHASPRSMMMPPPPLRPSSAEERKGSGRDEWSESLFYAYAKRSDYPQLPPYIVTFASAAIAQQWWSLVRDEYPESERVSPQLFILKGDDMQEQIQDNPKFYDLRNKWFYTPSDDVTGGASVIPLQDWRGHSVAAPPEENEDTFDMTKLNQMLEKMNKMISGNSEQIAALSVAQSAGLQRMQEINESNSTQIKTLTDNQNKLQSLLSDNASHYIALCNSSFSNQEQLKTLIHSNADQVKALADGHGQLTSTCADLIHTIERLGNSVSKVNKTVSQLGITAPASDTSSVTSQHPPFSSVGNRISPPPRKLNRRIKGVWYEYDTSTSPISSPRNVGFLDTPPKSPNNTRN